MLLATGGMLGLTQLTPTSSYNADVAVPPPARRRHLADDAVAGGGRHELRRPDEVRRRLGRRQLRPAGVAAPSASPCSARWWRSSPPTSSVVRPRRCSSCRRRPDPADRPARRARRAAKAADAFVYGMQGAMWVGAALRSSPPRRCPVRPPLGLRAVVCPGAAARRDRGLGRGTARLASPTGGARRCGHARRPSRAAPTTSWRPPPRATSPVTPALASRRREAHAREPERRDHASTRALARRPGRRRRRPVGPATERRCRAGRSPGAPPGVPVRRATRRPHPAAARVRDQQVAAGVCASAGRASATPAPGPSTVRENDPPRPIAARSRPPST